MEPSVFFPSSTPLPCTALLTHLLSLTRKGFFQVLLLSLFHIGCGFFLEGGKREFCKPGSSFAVLFFLSSLSPPHWQKKWTSLPSPLCPLGYMVFYGGCHTGGGDFPVTLSLSLGHAVSTAALSWGRGFSDILFSSFLQDCFSLCSRAFVFLVTAVSLLIDVLVFSKLNF